MKKPNPMCIYTTTRSGELPPMLMRSQHIQRLIVAAQDEGDIMMCRAELSNAAAEYGNDFAWYQKQLTDLTNAKLTNIRLSSLKRAYA